jgi:hypothetical protein
VQPNHPSAMPASRVTGKTQKQEACLPFDSAGSRIPSVHPPKLDLSRNCSGEDM